MPQVLQPPPALDEIDQLLERFEAAWQGDSPPSILKFVSKSGSPALRQYTLTELIKIDLDHRWRRAAQNPAADEKDNANGLPRRPCLEDYVRRFPILGPLDQLPVALIAEEYGVRHSWGDQPKQNEYFARFPVLAAKLGPLLVEMDEELTLEEPAVRAFPPQRIPTPLASVEDFLDMLREKPLLSPGKLDQLAMEHLQRPFTDARALARNLLERSWLTPYQVNQILLGQGEDLVLPPYILLERLGEGLRGKVFKAWHYRLKRMVALKVIKKELLDEPEAVNRFYQEMQAVSQLSHPNVVHAYDAGPIAQTHFLAMEFVEGIDLAKLVKQSGPLPVPLACEYIGQVALGLQHAHVHGLVHRDIKPANLLLTHVQGWSATGLVKILDMGLARLRRKDRDPYGNLTQEGTVMGTPDYMSPEQAIDPRTADIRTDIYSLGCTFYYLLAGRVPFPGGNLIEKVDKHRKQTAQPVEKVRPEVPPEVGNIVRKLMAKKPEQRYQTPVDVAEALLLLADPQRPTIYSPQRLLQLGSFFRRNPRWSVPGLVATLLLGVVGLFALVGSSHDGTVPASPPRPAGLRVAAIGNQPWQDTFIDIPAGGTVTIRASGTWKKRSTFSNADGNPNAGKKDAMVPAYPAMALLARVGDEDVPRLMGTEKTFQSAEGGRLFVQANTLSLDDVTGAMELEVHGGIRSRSFMPAWQLGFGQLHEGSSKLIDFQPLRYFPWHGWQGSPYLPDPKTGWVYFRGDTGHPGDKRHCAIRRWIVPRDCVITLTGSLEHHQEDGDGVVGRVLVSRQGEVGKWEAHNNAVETTVSGLEVQQGDVIDVVVDCKAYPENDTFQWRPVLFLVMEKR